MPKYTFYTDPGHGWLRVPMTEIVALNIADKISSYSYQKNGYVYLEEDCDMGLFVLATTTEDKARQWCSDNIIDVYHERTPIRAYDRYQGV